MAQGAARSGWDVAETGVRLRLLSRRDLVAALASTGTALAAACGQAGQPAGQQVPAGKVIELRVHARAGSERDGYQRNVDNFNTKFAGRYKATYEPITGDLYVGQETLMAGGTIGDVHYAHQSNIKFQQYAVQAAAVALDPLIGKDRAFKLSDWPQRAQDAMKVVDGKVFGLPVRGQVAWQFLYYNRDMLRTAGIPEPTPDWTLDTLLQHARRLQKPGTDFYPVGNSWGGFEVTVAHVRRFNGEFFDPPNGGGRKCTLDSAACVQAFRFFHDNRRAGLFAPRQYGWNEFGEGRMAMYFGRLAGERATAKQRAGNNFQWTFQIVPKGPTGRRGGFLSIDMQQVNSQSKNRDAAWELLKWVTNKESGINLALQPEGSLTPGFRKDVYCADELVNDARFPKDAMKVNCENIEQPEGYTYPHNFRLTQPGAIQEALNRYVLEFDELKQEPTPSVLRQMVTDVQAILDLPRL